MSTPIPKGVSRVGGRVTDTVIDPGELPTPKPVLKAPGGKEDEANPAGKGFATTTAPEPIELPGGNGAPTLGPEPIQTPSIGDELRDAEKHVPSFEPSEDLDEVEKTLKGVDSEEDESSDDGGNTEESSSTREQTEKLKDRSDPDVNRKRQKTNTRAPWLGPVAIAALIGGLLYYAT